MPGAGSRPVAALAVAALLLAGCGGDDDPPPGRGGQVNIGGFKYLPRTVTVKAGSSVTWANRDKAPHTATSEEGAAARFDTHRLIARASKTIRFDKPGDYPYYCVFHPFMSGTVKVVE